MVRNYINGVVSKTNVKLVSDRRFTVVMDTGNGAQGVAAPYLVEALGCKLITINSVVDGAFPGRGPEPTPETLGDLASAVRSTGADFGVAYDGDGDRSIFCDESGRVVWGDQSGCLVADYVLEKHPQGSVVTSIASGQAIDAVARRHGARVYRTKVGSVDVSRAIIERGAVFGFEENGGCIYQPHVAVRDGGMTTALMLECLAAKGMAFSKALSFVVPTYYQAKAKVPAEGKKIDPVMKAVERQAGGEIDRLDGMKIKTDERSWVLVRPSGTEPIVRIFAESDSQEDAERLVRKYVKVVRAALS